MKDTSAAPPDLAALTASRICHDVASPLGAAINGLELLELAGAAPDGEEHRLIAQSVARARARLRHLQIAFGAAAPGQRIAHGEIRDLLRELTGEARVLVDWQVAQDRERGEVKLAFLLQMCLGSGMPRGGGIVVQAEGPRWTLTARPLSRRDPPPEWEALTRMTPPERITAPMLHFAAAPAAARALGRTIRTELTEETITLAF